MAHIVYVLLCYTYVAPYIVSYVDIRLSVYKDIHFEYDMCGKYICDTHNTHTGETDASWDDATAQQWASWGDAEHFHIYRLWHRTLFSAPVLYIQTCLLLMLHIDCCGTFLCKPVNYKVSGKTMSVTASRPPLMLNSSMTMSFPTTPVGVCSLAMVDHVYLQKPIDMYYIYQDV